MSAPQDDPKNVPFGDVSDSETQKPVSEDRPSLKQEFNKRAGRLQVEDLEASDVYQRFDDVPSENGDPPGVVGELEDPDDTDFGFDSESSSVSPTPPKVDVTGLDPSMVYSPVDSEAGLASEEEKEVSRDEGDDLSGEDFAAADQFGDIEIEVGEQSGVSADSQNVDSEDESDDDWISKMSEKVKEAAEEDYEITKDLPEVELPKVGFLAKNGTSEDSDGEAPFGETEFAVESVEAAVEKPDSDFDPVLDQEDVEEIESQKESSDLEEGLDPKLPEVGFRAPNVTPIILDRKNIYGQEVGSETVVDSETEELGSSAENEIGEEIESPKESSDLEEGLDPKLPEVGFRAPNVTPIILDRKNIYGREVEGESSADSETEELGLSVENEIGEEVESHEEAEELPAPPVPELPEVGFRAPNITPVLLNRDEIYVEKESGTESTDEPSGELEADVEAKVEVVENNDQEERAVALKKPQVEEMEVIESEKQQSTSLSQSGNSEKPISKWAFWKRPSKRDQQLARISEGYLEMVDLVRAIRGQLETQNENNLILRDSLSHLPEAMNGLDSFSKSQHTVGEALKEIHGEMQNYSAKDEKLADSMNGFNDTLKGMDGTSKATMQTFDRVQERMRDSDIRMENLFQNVQNTEEKVSDTMVRLQRNMAVMQYIFLFCLMIVIGVLVFALAGRKDEAAPVQKIILETPAAPAASGGDPGEID